jgi:hypothetical protein
METKPIYVVGDENGIVYSPTPNTIYAREHFLSGHYGKTYPVDIPEKYREVRLYPGERIFVVFEGDKAYFKGKDFRSHISEITVHINAEPDLSPETAAALGTLIQIAITAIENDEIVEDDLPFVEEQLPSDNDDDAVMLLTFEEADFMHQVCQFDGLIVYTWQREAIDMAEALERGGLVRVQDCGGFVIVSAVRPEAGEE